MLLGLDIHGVITKNPELFSALTNKLVLFNHEVHVLTGVEDGDRVRKELSLMGIAYTHFFSITSYHKKIGTHVTYKDGDLTQPLIAPPKWDRTKADYCRMKQIDIHVDDSEIYGHYFKDIYTQYLIFNEGAEQFLSLLLKEDR